MDLLFVIHASIHVRLVHLRLQCVHLVIRLLIAHRLQQTAYVMLVTTMMEQTKCVLIVTTHATLALDLIPINAIHANQTEIISHIHAHVFLLCINLHSSVTYATQCA